MTMTTQVTLPSGYEALRNPLLVCRSGNGLPYHLTEDTFIEPQAELVYGAGPGKHSAGKTVRWT